MKKIILLFAIFCALQANAQNYLINFTGSGATTTVTTVKVENLTKSTSLTLNGVDILHLTVLTGVNTIEDNHSSELKIYPNPMTDNSTFEIIPPIEGNAVISVCDMTGKTIAQIQSYLENSPQEFRLSGLKKGFYLINFSGNNYKFSGKLLCNGESNETAKIEKLRNSVQAVDEKAGKTGSKGTLATVDMAYTTGDRLKFTSNSGNYSTIVTDTPTQDKTIAFNFIACTDGDNINYPVAEIGSQVWMAENLKTTKYQNGDLIGTTTPSTLDISNETTPKYHWAFNANESNAVTMGRLYTFYAITDNRGVCPSGWHIPSDEEWTTLTTYLGGEPIAGGKLKETGTIHWASLNTGATNETGFTSLPGGLRSFDGYFLSFLNLGRWWSATEASSDIAYGRTMNYNNANVYRNMLGEKDGNSVRCIKNN